MNPYSRFSLVSNSVSAALIVAALAVYGGPIFDAIRATAGTSDTALYAGIGAGVTVLVVFWLAMTEAIFPTLFRFNIVRKMVLGKYHVEGTWLQSERDGGQQRMSVIDIQPDGKGFIFSGYSLNEDLEIEANTLIEFSKFEWPFMTYKYRNSLSDGADGQREGVGEIQFEMNRSSAKRYNGFAQFVKNAKRLKIEGAKLTSGREVRTLRTLEGRREVFQKYWELFFNRSIRKDAPIPSAGFVERRSGQDSVEGPVVARRRKTDWREDPPQAEMLAATDQMSEVDLDDINEDLVDVEEIAGLEAYDDDGFTGASAGFEDPDLDLATGTTGRTRRRRR